jgi:hypothetical protein
MHFKINKMKKALGSSLLNLSKQLHLITAQIVHKKEKKTTNKSHC